MCKDTFKRSCKCKRYVNILLHTHKKIINALFRTGLVSIIQEIQEGNIALKVDFQRKHIENVCIKLIVHKGVF